MKIEIRVIDEMPEGEAVLTLVPVPRDEYGDIDGARCAVLKFDPAKDVTGPGTGPLTGKRLCELLLKRLESEQGKYAELSEEWLWWDTILRKVDQARREFADD